MLINVNRAGKRYEIESDKIQEGDRHISGREFTPQEIEYFKKPKIVKVEENKTEEKQKKVTKNKTLSSKSK